MVVQASRYFSLARVSLETMAQRAAPMAPVKAATLPPPGAGEFEDNSRSKSAVVCSASFKSALSSLSHQFASLVHLYHGRDPGIHGCEDASVAKELDDHSRSPPSISSS
jgi:hypothetical protein